MTKRKYLDESRPKYKTGGSVGPIIGPAILNNIIKKYKGDGNTLYHRNVYNLVDPTASIPKTVFDLYNYKLIADEALKPKGYIKKYREKIEPLAEAAWAKRLGLPYDTSILISNNDGTFKLNDNYEQELPIDTNFYKTRIANNKSLLQKYNKGGGTERNKVLKMAIGEDEAALNALRKTYKTGKWVSFNEQAHKSRHWIDNGDVKLDISPLSALQNFSGRYNAADNTFEYFDIYDFNDLEPIVPGNPFTIKGKINLNKKYGGLITTRPLLKSGGSIYIKPSHRGRLTELKARTGKSESELYNDGNPAHKKMVVFARNARKWHH